MVAHSYNRHEIEEKTGVKEREIRYFTQKGLISPSIRKNEHLGHLYSDEDIKKLLLLRFYKELGYNTTEMTKMLKKEGFDVIEELQIKIKELKENIKSLEKVVKYAENMVDMTYRDIKDTQNFIFNIMDILGIPIDYYNAGIKLAELFNHENIIIGVTEEEKEELETKILKKIDSIMSHEKNSIAAEDSIVQEEIKNINDLLSEYFFDSRETFLLLIMLSISNEEMISLLKQKHGIDGLEYLWSSLSYYLDNASPRLGDIRMNEIINEILTLLSNGIDAESEEMQNQIYKIDKLYSQSKIYKDGKAIPFLYSLISNKLGEFDILSMYPLSEGTIKMQNFIISAMETYIKNHKLDRVIDKAKNEEEE